LSTWVPVPATLDGCDLSSAAIFFAKGICISRRFVYKPANHTDGLRSDGGFGE